MHPTQVLQLQALAGNRAVTALLDRQPEPSPSAPGSALGTPLPGPAVAAADGRPPLGVAAPRPAPAVAGPNGRTPAPVVQRGLWDRLKGGVRSLASGVANLAGGIKDRVLGTLAGWAKRIPGYGLLCLVLGRDVVTGAAVDRSPVNLIGALVGLIPGGQAIFENLQRSGALQRAADWFGAAVSRLGLTWDAIRGLFSRAWDALGAGDLLDPAGAWAKIAAIFGPPLQRLRAFAASAAGKLMELVFEGALSLAGGLGARVMAIVRRAGGVLGTIVRDPIRFAGNLVAAVRGGLGRFAANIGAHLRSGLFAWLTGALRGAVALPARLDWRGILGFILDLLGLTWAWVRTRLVRLLGEPTVRRLETAVSWVAAMVTGGLGAIADRILSFATGLIDTVIGGIRDWVARSVVGAAITRLIAMFNPAGAIIGAIVAVYNTIRFFIERAQQLAALARSIFDSIAAIAAGSIGNAITAVEQSMARALPVILGFLARLLGLGDLATPIRNIINRARALIDKALDKVISWIAGVARKLVGRGRPAGEAGRGPAAGQIDPRRRAADLLVKRLQGDQGEDELRATVAAVRRDLQPQGLRRLDLEPAEEPGEYYIVAQASDPIKVAKARKKKPPVRTATVTLQARIVFDRPAVAAIERGRGSQLGFYDYSLPRARQRRTRFAGEVSGIVPAAPGTDVPPGQPRFGSFLIRPEDPSTAQEVVIKSWNSGDPARESNASHAERFFFPWLEQARRGGGVKEVHLQINLSPCSICAGYFPDLRQTGIAASLTYVQLYEGRDRENPTILLDSTTTQESLDRIEEMGWEVNGPSPRWKDQDHVRREREAALNIIRIHQ